MSSTKKKIIEASVRLFNENGLDSVRLQQIAEEVGISVGNLAYHYKNKEAIIESVYEQVFEEFNTIFRQYLAQPDLTNFDAQIVEYYQFFTRNHFYLTEFLKVNSSQTSHYYTWQTCVSKMMIQLRSRLQFMVNNGDLLPESHVGQYESLAEQIWMVLVFYIPQCNMMGRPIEEVGYRKKVWTLLKPYLSTQGQQEFTSLILPQLWW